MLKNKTVIGSIFLCAVALLGHSCNKKCNNPHYYLTDRQLSFLDFDKGSYWIMQDSATGDVDSIRLENEIIYTWSNPSIPSGKCRDLYEEKKLIFKSYLDGNDISCRVRAKDNAIYVALPGNEEEVRITFGQFPKSYMQNNVMYNEVYSAKYDLDPFVGNVEGAELKINNEVLFIKLKYYNPERSKTLQLKQVHVMK